jgi:hypothetical protein
MRSASERIGLPSGSQVSLFVVLVGPDLSTTILNVLSGSSDTCWLTHVEIKSRKLKLTSFFEESGGGKGREVR